MAIDRDTFRLAARDKGMLVSTVSEAAWHIPIHYVLAWIPEEEGCLTTVETRTYSLYDFANSGIGRFDSFDYAYASYVLVNASAPSDA